MKCALQLDDVLDAKRGGNLEISHHARSCQAAIDWRSEIPGYIKEVRAILRTHALATQALVHCLVEGRRMEEGDLRQFFQGYNETSTTKADAKEDNDAKSA